MEIYHRELRYIFDKFFTEELKNCIKQFIKDVEVSGKEYSTTNLWIQDQMIGGIGGYCMPSEPVKNPFPAGIERELYRPLQYARSEIEIIDVRVHPRHVIHMSGMHLEVVCRLFLKNTANFGQFRFSNITLGKAVHKISDMNVIDDGIIDIMQKFVPVFNRAKHDVNQDESRDRLFSAYDAVVAYFTARLIGVALLQKINIEDSFGKYEITE